MARELIPQDPKSSRNALVYVASHNYGARSRGEVRARRREFAQTRAGAASPIVRTSQTVSVFFV